LKHCPKNQEEYQNDQQIDKREAVLIVGRWFDVGTGAI
jgi:hypothetical protein